MKRGQKNYMVEQQKNASRLSHSHFQCNNKTQLHNIKVKQYKRYDTKRLMKHKCPISPSDDQSLMHKANSYSHHWNINH